MSLFDAMLRVMQRLRLLSQTQAEIFKYGTLLIKQPIPTWEKVTQE